MRHRILLAAPLLLAAVSAEEAAPVVRLSLEQAVARAREVSARLAEFAAREAAAVDGIRVAQSERRPRAEVAGGYARWSDIPEFTTVSPTGETQVIVPNIPDNWTARLGASVPLYTGGRAAALGSVAEHAHAAATSDTRTARADLALETAHAWWSLLTAREAERVLGESVAAYEAHLVDAGNRERVGLAARSEVLAVEVERDRARLERIRAANAAAVTEADLTRLLDLPSGTRIEAADALGGAVPPPEALAVLLDEARAARPERAAPAARAEAEEARAEAERSARRPQAGLAGQREYANPNRRVFPPNASWEDTWDVGASVSFALSDGGHAAAATARASAEAEALRRRLYDLDRWIHRDVVAQRLGLQSALAALPVAEGTVAAAAETLRVSRERYREGVMPSSELLDAEVALLRAGLDRAWAQAEARLARAALDRVVGR